MEQNKQQLGFTDFPTADQWDFARWVFPVSPEASASSERWAIEPTYVAYPASSPWQAIQESFSDHGLSVLTRHRISDSRRRIAPFPLIESMRFPEVVAGFEPSESIAGQALRIAKACMVRHGLEAEMFLGPFYFHNDESMLTALPSLIEKAAISHVAHQVREPDTKGKFRL